jgi:GNAT superfamily N-acetyltransferase
VIRPMTEGDFDAVWSIFHAVVALGDSYVFAAETPRHAAIAYFFGPGIISRVSERDGRVVGMYKLIPNRIDRGSHVANASFMVAPAASGRGVGRELGEHCLREAKRAGFDAMQFNFVVSTNTAAVSTLTSCTGRSTTFAVSDTGDIRHAAMPIRGVSPCGQRRWASRQDDGP